MTRAGCSSSAPSACDGNRVCVRLRAMSERAMNFNPGPAALPLEALERAQRELVDFADTGMSIMEHSHRGEVYEVVHQEAIALLRELIGVGETHHVLLLQGGARLAVRDYPDEPPAARHRAPTTWSPATGPSRPWPRPSWSATAREAANTEQDGTFVRVPAARRARARRERRLPPHHVEQHALRDAVGDLPGHRRRAADRRHDERPDSAAASTCRASGSSTPAPRRTSARPA